MRFKNQTSQAKPIARLTGQNPTGSMMVLLSSPKSSHGISLKYPRNIRAKHHNKREAIEKKMIASKQLTVGWTGRHVKKHKIAGIL